MSPPFTQVYGQNKTNKKDTQSLWSTSREHPLLSNKVSSSTSRITSQCVLSSPWATAQALIISRLGLWTPSQSISSPPACPIFNTETCIAISLVHTANFHGLPCTVKPWLTSLAWRPRSFTVYDPNLPSTIICHYLLLHPTPTNQPHHLTHGCLNLSALWCFPYTWNAPCPTLAPTPQTRIPPREDLLILQGTTHTAPPQPSARVGLSRHTLPSHSADD